jgi:hypothetical protein
MFHHPRPECACLDFPLLALLLMPCRKTSRSTTFAELSPCSSVDPEWPSRYPLIQQRSLRFACRFGRMVGLTLFRCLNRMARFLLYAGDHYCLRALKTDEMHRVPSLLPSACQHFWLDWYSRRLQRFTYVNHLPFKPSPALRLMLAEILVSRDTI